MYKMKVTKVDDSFKLGHVEESREVTMSSPAVKIIIDFHKSEPLTLNANTNIVSAQEIMTNEHSKLKVIVNPNGDMIGALSFKELTGEKPIILAKEKNSREEINVSEIMTPIDMIHAVSLSEVKTSTVKEVLDLLKNEHWQYVFVADQEKKEICGLISAENTAKKVGTKLKLDISPTFHSIFVEMH